MSVKTHSGYLIRRSIFLDSPPRDSARTLTVSPSNDRLRTVKNHGESLNLSEEWPGSPLFHRLDGGKVTCNKLAVIPDESHCRALSPSAALEVVAQPVVTVAGRVVGLFADYPIAQLFVEAARLKVEGRQRRPGATTLTAGCLGPQQQRPPQAVAALAFVHP